MVLEVFFFIKKIVMKKQIHVLPSKGEGLEKNC